MAEILTNEQNYYDIADTIRQMKNVNTTYKPREMASALKDIYSNEVEGVPPLSFEANGNNLLNYRIDGASGGVGERTKNLLQNTATTQTKNGVTFTVNEDKSISCNGTASGNAFFKIGDIQLKKNCIMSGCPEDGDNNSYIMRLYNNGSVFKTDSGDGVLINSEIQNGYAEIRIAAGYTCDNLTFYPMIRLAEIEDNTYEPYGYKVPVVVSGKNLLQNNATSQTVNGVTFTVNNDGSVTCNGTPNSGIYSDLLLSGTLYGEKLIIEYGNYILSSIGSSSALVAIIGNGTHEIGRARGNDVTFTDDVSWVLLRCYGVEEPQTVYPMIRLASIEDDTYEPYIEETTNIYLEEPICNVNNNIDYIDFSSQSKMKKTGTIEFVNSSNWLLEGEHNFYYDMIIETASPKSLVVSNKVPSLVTSMAETIANQYTENVWISAGQRVNLWLADIDHTLTALQNWLSQEPLIVQYQLQNHSEISVNLPAIPTLDGTNTLSIDTTVQPSNVYIQAPKDSIEAIQIANELEEI